MLISFVQAHSRLFPESAPRFSLMPNFSTHPGRHPNRPYTVYGKSMIISHHAIRLRAVPKVAINMAASISREIAPFEFEMEVEVESPPDTDPVDFEDCEVVVEGDANCAPTASAPALKAAKDSPLPSGPGFTANTIPWPQWLV